MDQELMEEIYQVERHISRFRASLFNHQDYIPILRLFPFLESKKLAIECREKRDWYLEVLLKKLKLEMSKGTAIPCITYNILQDLNNNQQAKPKISQNELKSISLTMVSAGLDTMPTMLIYFIGHMSQVYGQGIQQSAYHAIQDAFSDGESWSGCLQDGSIPYIQALVQETLRFSPMPISLPRRSIKHIKYTTDDGEVTIPANSILIMNTFAANFDELVFENPFEFNPGRYLDHHIKPPHFTFGAGTRMCAGANLAERELYIAIIRLISSFEILPPHDIRDMMPSHPLELFKTQTSLVVDPPPFKVRLVPRLG